MYDATVSWHLLLARILNGERVAPRGQETREVVGCRSSIRMRSPVVTTPERRLGYRFMPAEAAWILSGDNKVESISPYSKMIANFSDDGVTFRGAYGPPIMDQLGWCADQLIKDPFTRQAVLTIWRPRPGPSKDIPCTVAMQFFLRRQENTEDTLRLHTVVTMRSSDTWLGWPYDVFNFSMVSGYLLALILHLRPGFGVELGDLVLNSGSQHLYERHTAYAEQIIGRRDDSDVKELFEYEPFDPGVFWQRPHDLVDHLWGLAERDQSKLRGPWLAELFDYDDNVSRSEPINT